MPVAKIAATESLSNAFTVGDGRFLGLQIPAAWDAGATAVTFQVSADDGATFYDLYGSDGTPVSLAVTPGTCVSLAGIALDVAPWKRMKIRSGTPSVPAAQAADVEVTVVWKD